MFGRVLSPSTQTTYNADYNRKPINRVRGINLSTKVTTGNHYSATPQTLYQSDTASPAELRTTLRQYTRPPNAKQELYKLPPAYDSTVRPDLVTNTPNTDYQHCFGQCGQKADVKHLAWTPRHLSKQTQAECLGTTKKTYHPPGYEGYISYDGVHNRGKKVHEDRTLIDYTWQYHTHTTGYGGYTPFVGMDSDLSNVKKTPTTYRDLCAAVKWDK